VAEQEAVPTRIGFLYDGDPDTDLMTALYEHDDEGVRIRVPYLGSTEDKHGRWWSQGVHYGDDPNRTKYSYSPPAELDYFDNKGPVGFIGCRSGPSNFTFGGFTPGAGVGVINARFAIEGALYASNYLKINGFRSEIDGLGIWLGYSALRTTILLPKDGKGHEISTSMASVDGMPLGRPLNLAAVAHGISSGTHTPEVTYRSKVYLETLVQAAKPWEDHLTLHVHIRDLLRIAAWHPVNFQSHQAATTKETVEISGDEKQTWREIRTVTTGIAKATRKPNDLFLFAYQDVGMTGVTRWLRIAKSYRRGIDPLVRLLDLQAGLDAHIAQLGIAVEAVGYQALIESGRSPRAANNTSVEKRIDYLLTLVAGALKFDDSTFAEDFATTYNSVKHANRAPVPQADKIDHYRKGIELLRTWVAVRLGVSKSALKSRK